MRSSTILSKRDMWPRGEKETLMVTVYQLEAFCMSCPKTTEHLRYRTLRLTRTLCGCPYQSRDSWETTPSRGNPTIEGLGENINSCAFIFDEACQWGQCINREPFGPSILVGNLPYLILEFETMPFYVASATLQHYGRFVPWLVNRGKVHKRF